MESNDRLATAIDMAIARVEHYGFFWYLATEEELRVAQTEEALRSADDPPATVRASACYVNSEEKCYSFGADIFVLGLA